MRIECLAEGRNSCTTRESAFPLPTARTARRRTLVYRSSLNICCISRSEKVDAHGDVRLRPCGAVRSSHCVYVRLFELNMKWMRLLQPFLRMWHASNLAGSLTSDLPLSTASSLSGMAPVLATQSDANGAHLVQSTPPSAWCSGDLPHIPNWLIHMLQQRSAHSGGQAERDAPILQACSTASGSSHRGMACSAVRRGWGSRPCRSSSRQAVSRCGPIFFIFHFFLCVWQKRSRYTACTYCAGSQQMQKSFFFFLLVCVCFFVVVACFLLQ